MSKFAHFPNCSVYMMEQRTPQWHAIRAEKITASEAGAWLAKCTTATAKKARAKAICKILGQRTGIKVPDDWQIDADGPEPTSKTAWAIWRGINLEEDAMKAFNEATGEQMQTVGFCTHNSGVAGCSPDGLSLDAPEGFEGKCPLPDTHCRYVLDDKLPDEYRDQVHFSMAVTGASAWWFQSYCPGLPSLRVRVLRDDYTAQIEAGIHEFKKELDAANAKMSAAYLREFGGGAAA